MSGLRVALLVAGSLALLSAEPPPQFERDVAPILQQRCWSCHGAAAQTSGLDLRTLKSMLKGGSHGPALVKGSAEQSSIYRRIADKSMPFGGEGLSETETQIIREWIDAGAPGPREESAASTSEAGQGHWAFQPPMRPEIPTVKNAAWVRSPVDAFVLARLEEEGIRPAAPADRATLLRRTYLDVIGLPPTPEEISSFLNNKSANAYQEAVEGLLARPQYGERWARHWLDLVRYAESNGYERDRTKPHAWRYRDYVIDAFNRDKPYDRFLTEQLAGDELADSNAEAQIAATFLRLGTWDDEPADPKVDRYDQLDDVLGVTATALMGLTLRCARCHDHKFEPLTQKDYYRLLAVFEPLKRPQDGQADLDRLAGTEEELSDYQIATAEADDLIAPFQRQVEDIGKTIQRRLFAKSEVRQDLSWLDHAETVLAFRTDPKNRTPKQKELIEGFNERLDLETRAEASGKEKLELEGLQGRIKAGNDARPPEPPRAYVWYEDDPEPPVSRVLLRGDVSTPGDEVHPGVPAVLARSQLEPPQPTKKTTGRRLWLARWVTAPDNPLVARVMVNRLWQWHFGEGLVASESNFGVMGKSPSHPKLLDYLATEFVSSGWSVKHIHRVILNSSTYGQASSWNDKAAGIDPEGELLWRWKPRRLEAEVIRDSLLAMGKRLNLKMAGPSVYASLPSAVLEGQSRPGEGWGNSDENEAARRSIYIFAKRSLAVPELEVLDAPDTTSSCEQRMVSTTGPQALTFLNGDLTNEQARHLASRLQTEAGSQIGSQVEHAFRLVLSRPATTKERKAVLAFLKAQERKIKADPGADELADDEAARRALEAFCLVLLNSNEFFYLN